MQRVWKKMRSINNGEKENLSFDGKNAPCVCVCVHFVCFHFFFSLSFHAFFLSRIGKRREICIMKTNIHMDTLIRSLREWVLAQWLGMPDERGRERAKQARTNTHYNWISTPRDYAHFIFALVLHFHRSPWTRIFFFPCVCLASLFLCAYS